MLVRPSRFFSVSLALILLACGGEFGPPRSQAAGPDLSGVTQTLIALLQKQDTTHITADDYQSTSLQEIITFGTPTGYRIKLRYLNFGVSLTEALKICRDPDIRRRLIEMVQWSRNPQVRAQAIITLATMLDPSHKKYFKEAVLDGKVGIRFAAVEALQTWAQPDSVPLLRLAMERDNSPLMRLYAAQALLALSQNETLAPAVTPIKDGIISTLWQGLDNESWVIRAIAARYIGDYGKPDDYTKLMSYLNRETKNDFVVAELSIAALKLISKKGEKVAYSPSAPGWRDNDEVKYALGKDDVIEIEPLIIVPPQLRIPPSLQAAAQINAKLLTLIRDRLSVPLEAIQSQDPVLQELNSMVTPSGFALKERYAELSYLVVEALAGTPDPLLRSELQKLAGTASNPLVRASALIALSYSKDPSDIYLIQDAIAHPNAIVRMGALEAIEIGRFAESVPQVVFVAGNDKSAAVATYAMQVLARFGNPTGRQLMLSAVNSPDWPSRAMAYWFLSRYGDSDDYAMVSSRISVEENPFVQSEIALASLRLAPVNQ